MEGNEQSQQPGVHAMAFNEKEAFRGREFRLWWHGRHPICCTLELDPIKYCLRNLPRSVKTTNMANLKVILFA